MIDTCLCVMFFFKYVYLVAYLVFVAYDPRQSEEKNECFREISRLRYALERPKGESESIRRLRHN